jgi:hypothetical protein
VAILIIGPHLVTNIDPIHLVVVFIDCLGDWKVLSDVLAKDLPGSPLGSGIPSWAAAAADNFLAVLEDS